MDEAGDALRRMSTFATCSTQLTTCQVTLAKEGFSYNSLTSAVTCESCKRVLEADGTPAHYPGCKFSNMKDTATQKLTNNSMKSSNLRDSGQGRSNGRVNHLQLPRAPVRLNSTGSSHGSEEDLTQLHVNRSGGYRHHVDPREIRSRLDTPVVRAIIEKGTPVNLIREAIERRLMNFGDDFPNARSLLRAVYEIENEDSLYQLVEHNEELTELEENADLPASPRDPGEVDPSPEWTCKVCLDAEVRVVFLPCAHLVCCHRCAVKIHSCPICRMRILRSVKASFD